MRPRGQIPGPDHFCIRNQRFPASSGADGAQPGHRFAGIPPRPRDLASVGTPSARSEAARRSTSLGGYCTARLRAVLNMQS